MPRKSKKTAFVPRSMFLGALVTTSVVPVCACGGVVSGDVRTVAALGFDGGDAAREPDAPLYTVAIGAFDAEIFDVAARAFDAGADVRELGVALRAFDAGEDAPELGVAVKAFDAGDDAGFLNPVARRAFDAGEDARVLGVAACCFDAGKP